MAQTFWYDQQIRRWITQFIRVFSEFQVEYGTGTASSLVRIPVKYGDPSIQAATVQNNNSENTVISAPSMAIYIASLNMDKTRIQNPNFVERVDVRTRAIDPVTGEYTNQQGNAYSVERLMPVPYKLSLHVDIFTTNTTQKLQILEQILTLFNPIMELQSTSNYLDWTSLSYIELTNTTWSSRSIPVGTEAPMDVATLEFDLPIWLSAPAHVKKFGAAFKVITSLYNSADIDSIIGIVDESNLLLGTRQVVSFNNYSVFANPNGKLNLLFSDQFISDATINNPGTIVDDTISWPAALSAYGNIIPGYSQIVLTSSNFANCIVGNIAYTGNDTDLVFNVNISTLPANTLPDITSVIDPLVEGPGYGLPAISDGQTYLLTNAIGNSTGWGNVIANTNDIIQSNANVWSVIFSSANNTSNVQYVTNNSTNIQLYWSGVSWDISWLGKYTNANWSLII